MLRWVFAVLLVCTGVAPAAADHIDVVSFNVKWIGQYPQKENEILARIVQDFDLVFVQEVLAPPYAGTFPDGGPFVPDTEAKGFFDAMRAHGFKYVLSPEDTGTLKKNHNNGSGTEWFVAFYKTARVTIADDLPHGFLAADVTKNPKYDRVPYAFGFRFGTNKTDMVFVSTHLRPSSGTANKKRRKVELGAIAAWADAHDAVERDFVILGDMNIQNCVELHAVQPAAFGSLNGTCVATNVKNNRPYDHVMFRPNYSGQEISLAYGFKVIDLRARAQALWSGGNFPMGQKFEFAFSDHNPVHFRIEIRSDDD